MSEDNWTIPTDEISQQAGRAKADDHPFKLGQTARAEGKTSDSNPFTKGSWRHKRFLEGYNQRDRKAETSAKEKSAMAAVEPAKKRTGKSKKKQPAADTGTVIDSKEPKRARGKKATTPPLFEDLHDKKDQALIDQANKVKDCQDERMAWLKKESEARTLLLEMMHRRSLSTYTFEDMEIKVEGIKKVKVKKKKDEDGEGEEG